MDYREEIERAAGTVADALHKLGNNHAMTAAGTEYGAIEAFGIVVRDGCAEIAGAIEGLADAVRDLANTLVPPGRKGA